MAPVVHVGRGRLAAGGPHGRDQRPRTLRSPVGGGLLAANALADVASTAHAGTARRTRAMAGYRTQRPPKTEHAMRARCTSARKPRAINGTPSDDIDQAEGAVDCVITAC